MENVIHECKIIETENGFRIEITRDKDALREMLRGCRPQSFFGNAGPFGRGSGSWFRGRPNFWDWCDQWSSPEEEKEAEKSHH